MKEADFDIAGPIAIGLTDILTEIDKSGISSEWPSAGVSFQLIQSKHHLLGNSSD